jgi:outer membrane protein OmpA-like peptidoglycan-associated protein
MRIALMILALVTVLAGQAQTSFAVYFAFDKYTLTTAGRIQIDSFLSRQKDNLPGIILQLNGHCDIIGSDEYNNRLSGKRVAAVKQYFIDKGFKASHIGDEIGHGKKELLNENKTDGERQLNRRVEISFVQVVTTELPVTVSLKEKIADSATIAGTNIVLKNINFVGGMHQFLPSAKPMLDELLDAMITYPNLVIRVEGHICCIEFNGDGPDLETGINNLSYARAKAVRDFLIENDIAPERVSYKGFGHSTPIYPWPEKNEEEKTLNRRVEIKIISK